MSCCWLFSSTQVHSSVERAQAWEGSRLLIATATMSSQNTWFACGTCLRWALVWVKHRIVLCWLKSQRNWNEADFHLWSGASNHRLASGFNARLSLRLRNGSISVAERQLSCVTHATRSLYSDPFSNPLRLSDIDGPRLAGTFQSTRWTINKYLILEELHGQAGNTLSIPMSGKVWSALWPQKRTTRWWLCEQIAHSIIPICIRKNTWLLTSVGLNLCHSSDNCLTLKLRSSSTLQPWRESYNVLSLSRLRLPACQSLWLTITFRLFPQKSCLCWLHIVFNSAHLKGCSRCWSASQAERGGGGGGGSAREFSRFCFCQTDFWFLKASCRSSIQITLVWVTYCCIGDKVMLHWSRLSFYRWRLLDQPYVQKASYESWIFVQLKCFWRILLCSMTLVASKMGKRSLQRLLP